MAVCAVHKFHIAKRTLTEIAQLASAVLPIFKIKMNAMKKSTALAKTVTAPVSSVLMVTDSQRKASALIRHDQLLISINKLQLK